MTGIVNIIAQAAIAAGVSPALLLSVCFTESTLRNTVVPHDGHSASWGICQVKLATARELEPGIFPTHLMQPRINARIAAKYLRKQMDRYHGDVWLAVDAYNKGSAKSAYSKYVRKVKVIMKTKPYLKGSYDGPKWKT